MARKIWLTVKPQSKRESVSELAADHYSIAVNAPAKDGKANLRLVEVLAQHFHTAKSRIRILRGQTSRKKLIEID